jgi:phosphatidylglycerophosphatase A
MKWEQPNWPRFLPSNTVISVATLGPVGMRLPAPGTWGSFAGLLYFIVCFWGFGWIGNLLLSALGAYLAVGFCGEAEFRMGRTDPGEVILDEFVAMPLCFLGWGHLTGGPIPNWGVLIAGFLLFRFFDILKPLGIKKVQHVNAGWGIVIDDTLAALATCLTMHAGLWIWAAVTHPHTG